MQVCTSLQTDNHASTPPLSFLQAGCSSCRPTNSVKALKGYIDKQTKNIFMVQNIVMDQKIQNQHHIMQKQATISIRKTINITNAIGQCDTITC